MYTYVFIHFSEILAEAFYYLLKIPSHSCLQPLLLPLIKAKNCTQKAELLLPFRILWQTFMSKQKTATRELHESLTCSISPIAMNITLKMIKLYFIELFVFPRFEY